MALSGLLLCAISSPKSQERRRNALTRAASAASVQSDIVALLATSVSVYVHSRL